MTDKQKKLKEIEIQIVQAHLEQEQAMSVFELTAYKHILINLYKKKEQLEKELKR